MVNLQQFTTAQISSLLNSRGKLIFNSETNEIFFNSGIKYNEVLALNNSSRLGINTNNPLSTVDINSADGNCLRFTYNNTTGDATTYLNQTISSVGEVSFIASGSSPGFSFSGGGVAATLSTAAQPNITSLGTLTSLSLSGAISGVTTLTATTLVGTLSTSAQPNITSLGILTSLNVSGITILQTPLDEIYGGTGQTNYIKGDLLVADTTNTLAKLPIPVSNGTMLITDTTSSTGLKYGSNIFINYYKFGEPTNISTTSYTFPYYYGRNFADTDNIIINSSKTINLATTGLNGIAISTNLTGTIYANPTTVTITGTSTLFTTELQIGDIITIGTESRRIVSITSNTIIVINLAFTVLNFWTLAGTASLSATQKKYGTTALRSTTATGFGNILMGSNSGFNATAAAWTVEFYVYLSSTAAALSICSSTTASSFALAYTTTSTRMTISLGQGSSMNIANATAIVGTMAAATWYHVAIVFSGTTYKVFFNGTLGVTITSSLKITSTAFNNLRFGGNATTAFNGYIDEIRISNNIRYTVTFTALSAAFTSDANTISLNHFEQGTIAPSDDKVLNVQLNYNRGGKYYANSILYTYAINHNTTPGYILSTRSTIATLVDLPAGYLTTNCRQVPFFIPINFSNVPYTVFNYNINNYSIFTPITIISGATNTTVTTYQLAAYIPTMANMITLLLIHTHVGATSCGIIIGPTSTFYQTLLTNATAGITQLTITLPVFAALSINAYLSATASTTSYTLQLLGFSIDSSL